MKNNRINKTAWAMATAVILALGAVNVPASARENPTTACAHQHSVMGTSTGPALSPLAWIRQECPLLDVVSVQDVDDDFASADPCAR